MQAGSLTLLLGQIERMATGRDRPLLVAIDGRSGAGKSTLAAAIERTGDVAVIEGDTFYAGGSAATWEARNPGERADRCIDWRRQRPVLQTLRDGRAASWAQFDWEHPDWDDDDPPFVAAERICRAAPVVVLEGAYSARPELQDLLDLLVLVHSPEDIRHARLRLRDGYAEHADWNERWSSAEDHYFGVVMPPDAFDLVVED